MANRNLDVGWSIGKRLVTIRGNFVPLTGAGTIVASSVEGLGFGFAPTAGVMASMGGNVASKNFLTTTPGILRTGTGKYTVTLEDTYQACTGFSTDLGGPSTGTALWVQGVEPVANLASSTAAPVFTILIVNSSGTPTEASANMRVYFDFELRDSTVGRQKP